MVGAEDLVVMEIEGAATRPPMFLGLPRKLSSLLLCVGCVLFVIISSTFWEAFEIGTIALLWFAIRPLIAMDYHGFDNFLVHAFIDWPRLDSHEWGGTRFSPLPVQPTRLYGMLSDV